MHSPGCFFQKVLQCTKIITIKYKQQSGDLIFFYEKFSLFIRCFAFNQSAFAGTK
jgi:hypothetical protein